MKFIVKRQEFLKPLKQVSSFLGANQATPILGNLLLQVTENYLLVTGTDLEIELIARVVLNNYHEIGTTTVPARKFFNIFRALPENSEAIVTLENNRVLIQSGHSRYWLTTLPALDFPNLGDWKGQIIFKLSQSVLKQLIESTQFSMAHQDVRYYLNGMLLEMKSNTLRAVATDGHRLAVCTVPISMTTILSAYSVIIPRKGVIELVRMLDDGKDLVTLKIGRNNIRVIVKNYVFTSRLIDGSFPDYHRVFPKHPNNILQANCNMLKEAFTRIAILSNDKFRGVCLYLSANQLKITSKNQEQEEGEEILDVTYQGNEMDIGLNVSYILDVLNSLKSQEVQLLMTNGVSSVQIQDSANQTVTYVIMPMRL